YSRINIQDAINDGHAHISPIRNYPHQFKNYEGLPMGPGCAGTRYEFPILTRGLYNGGSPGADRVIFDHNGHYCALNTHTGAPNRNGFLLC
ncbi:Ribonuclease/ribotoxin, partial [Armillaria borealis]